MEEEADDDFEGDDGNDFDVDNGEEEDVTLGLLLLLIDK